MDVQLTAEFPQFYPIDNVTSSTADTDFYPVENLIQGPGVGFDAEPPYEKLVGGEQGNWVTDAPGGFPADYIEVAGAPVLVFDLGKDVVLAEISVWGYTTTNANGVKEFSLRFATEADGPEGFGNSIDANPIFTISNDDTVRNSFELEPVAARYVEMTLTDNHFEAPGDGSGGETPGGDRVGLGEVAFEILDVTLGALTAPFAVDFGTIEDNPGPQTMMVTLSNESEDTTVSVTGSTFTGDEPSYFSVGTIPADFAPGTSAEIELAFTPTALRGSFRAVLEIATNAAGEDGVTKIRLTARTVNANGLIAATVGPMSNRM